MAKKQIIPTKTPMPEQPPAERIKNYDEVPYGYTAEQAIAEAQRCLQCARPGCMAGCPVGINIPVFLKLAAEGDFRGAINLIKETNALPAVTGRVCPQEEQCEGDCALAKKFESVAIGRLERFVADWEAAQGTLPIPELPPPTGRKVAVVGSGPAGVTVAADLVRLGHHVTIFEALHEAGGVLVYGIPEFRLPKEIVRREVENLKKMGVRIETNVVVGKTVTIDELMNEEHYDAVFVATGAGLPRFLGVPGENLNGVYSANEFLTRINLMRAYEFPVADQPVYDCRGKDVAVVGGGNTAMDAVRSSLRLGARTATLIYRRSEAEMPARVEEVKHAKEEGVRLMTLTNPVELKGDDQGRLVAARCIRMELGEPDDSGRRRPVPVPGSEFELPIALVIVATGTTANPLVQSVDKADAVYAELSAAHRAYLPDRLLAA